MVKKRRIFRSTADLLSFARHEINNSLTAVNGYATLLSDRLGGRKATESRWAREIVRGSSRAIKLVDKLLDPDLIEK